MAVAPDLLVSSAAEVRPKVAVKAPAGTPEPSSDKAASFAKVFADERQGQVAAARPSDTGSTAAREALEQLRQNTGTPLTADSLLPAESGNLLPPMEEELAQIDPLVMLGLAGEETVLGSHSGEAVGAESGSEAALLGLSSESLEQLLEGGAVVAESALAVPVDAVLSSVTHASLAVPVIAAEVVVDPTVEKLNSAATVQVALQSALNTEAEKAAKAALEPSTAPGLEAQAKALSGSTVAVKGEPTAQNLELDRKQQAAALELSEPVSSGLKEADGEAPVDAGFRLNNLTQALGQANALQRLQVPGQPVAMQQNGWSEAVVDRVMWLSSQNLRSAEIQLDPAELGRLDVRITMNQDQPQITFSSPHAHVREALEAQMHRMREMFAQQGMGQLDVNVSDQSLARHSQGQGEGRSSGRDGGSAADTDEQFASEPVLKTPASVRGLVDFYA